MTRVIDRFGADAVDGLNMIALLLPGLNKFLTYESFRLTITIDFV